MTEQITADAVEAQDARSGRIKRYGIWEDRSDAVSYKRLLIKANMGIRHQVVPIQLTKHGEGDTAYYTDALGVQRSLDNPIIPRDELVALASKRVAT